MIAERLRALREAKNPSQGDVERRPEDEPEIRLMCAREAIPLQLTIIAKLAKMALELRPCPQATFSWST